jgi:hypothetical protein
VCLFERTNQTLIQVLTQLSDRLKFQMDITPLRDPQPHYEDFEDKNSYLEWALAECGREASAGQAIVLLLI